MDRHIVNPGRVWDPTCPPLARERPGDGAGNGAAWLGRRRALRALNFPVTGWGRTAKPGCLHGDDGLREALSTAAIVVTLLPKTPETENLLNAERAGLLPQGAVILNPGRGALIDDDALLRRSIPGTSAMRRWTCSAPNPCRRTTRSGPIPA
jgi:glyoxylate/hydroxypyruvate reductase